MVLESAKIKTKNIPGTNLMPSFGLRKDRYKLVPGKKTKKNKNKSNKNKS